MPPSASRTLPQYEIRRQLGRGGMGIVYQAFDRKHSRNVALKTLLNESDAETLALFRRELAVLSQISHPNIVDVYDSGEMDDGGRRKPFFVMPLLRGQTLQEMLEKSRPMAVNRLADIMVQTLKGLQAAHESGLIHRDLKPSNIFILEDYSVNIIDFGVAHLVNLKTTIGLKGTIYYMAPEQLTRKPLLPASDLFSLGVVCFEALTGRHPFEGRGEREIVDSILHHTPPLISELNPSVSQIVSLVIQKALAKDPLHRFPSALDMAECMQKAMRNEPIEYFNLDRIQPRIARAKKASAGGDHEYALEILAGLEAEGCILPEISALRHSIEQQSRQKTIQSLLDIAKRRFLEEEFQLALKKLHELDDIDPENAEAHALRAQIEDKRSWVQIDEWLKIAHQHLENRSFEHARTAVESALRIRPKDTRALKLQAEIDRREQDHKKLNQEKTKLFDVAVAARQRGDLDIAISKLERVLELDRIAPDNTDPSHSDAHQKLFNEVRSEQQALANSVDRARSHAANEEFTEALSICDECLKRYPSNVILHALRLDVLERRKQHQSGFIAKVRQAVGEEADLERRVSLLKDAIERYPAELSLLSSLEIAERKRDLVNGIVAVARSLEDNGQFTEALAQWDSLRIIHPEYPGLDFELERLQQRLQEQARIEDKTRRIDEIERALKLSEFPQALELCRKALEEFPGDNELLPLERQATGAIARRDEALRLLEEGRKLCRDGHNDGALVVLRQAYGLDEREPAIRLLLVEVLIKLATALRDGNLLAAEPLVDEALRIDPSNVRARSLRTLLLDRKYNQFVDEFLANSREKEAAGDLKAAIAEVEKILARYPQEARALRRKAQLENSTTGEDLEQLQRKHLDELQSLEQKAESTNDPGVLEALHERSVAIASKYPGEESFQAAAASILRWTEQARPQRRQDGQRKDANRQQRQDGQRQVPAGTPRAHQPQPPPPSKSSSAARKTVTPVPAQRRHRRSSGHKFPWILVPVAAAALSLVTIVATRIASLDAVAGSPAPAKEPTPSTLTPPPTATPGRGADRGAASTKAKVVKPASIDRTLPASAAETSKPDFIDVLAKDVGNSLPEEFTTPEQERAPESEPPPPVSPPVVIQEVPGALAGPPLERQQIPIPAPQAEITASSTLIRLSDQDPESVVVNWSADGADHVTIEPQDKFDQTLRGNCRLYPAHTLTIHLTAKGPGGSVSKEVKVEVDDSASKLPPSYSNRRCEPLAR